MTSAPSTHTPQQTGLQGDARVRRAKHGMGGPDFIGVGVQRSATSWLYSCLASHPQVYMPRKEVHFFDQHYDKGIDWYRGLFQGAAAYQIAGEFTPDYLSNPETMQRLKQAFPNARILVLLREPMERTLSALQLFQSHGHLKGLSLDEALVTHPPLLEKSLYTPQLRLLYSLFAEAQVFLRLQDHVQSDPTTVYRDCCSFLDIDENHTSAAILQVRNTSASPSGKARLLASFTKGFMQYIPSKTLRNRLKSSRLAGRLKTRIIATNSRQREAFRWPEMALERIREDVSCLEAEFHLDLKDWLRKYERI